MKKLHSWEEVKRYSPYFIRNMIFTTSTLTVVLLSLGFNFREILELQSVFALGASMAHIVGGLLSDKFGPEIAFALGKLIYGIGCLGLASVSAESSLFTTFYCLWGVGGGLYDGPDLLSVKFLGENVETAIRKADTLGLWGNLLSLIAAPYLLFYFGPKSVFIATAIFALCIPVVLLISSRLGVHKISMKTRIVLIPNSGAIRSIFIFSIALTLLKIGMLELQNIFHRIGFNVSWYGWLYAVITLIVIFCMNYLNKKLSILLLGINVTFLASILLGYSRLEDVSFIGLFILIRSMSRSVFFKDLVADSKNLSVGLYVAYANLISAGFIFLLAQLERYVLIQSFSYLVFLVFILKKFFFKRGRLHECS